MLTVIEKLNLQSERIAIFEKIDSVDVLEKMALQQRIIEIWELLGAGGSEQSIDEEDNGEALGKSLAQRFLDGEFDKSHSSVFIETLHQLEPEVNQGITLSQIIDKTNNWWMVTGEKEQADNMKGLS